MLARYRLEGRTAFITGAGGHLGTSMTLALAEAGAHVIVNTVSPGPFPRQSIQKENPEFVRRLSAKTPMKRVGQADDIAGPILFLASDASSYVTAINLPVDGGWTAW